MTTAVLAPPSPGAWELERTHFTKPPSRFMWQVFPAMMKGFGDGTREYGVLLDHIELAVIGGYMYSAPRPVGAPKGATAPPPRLLFKLLVHLHPEIRRRVRRSADAFRSRLWRKELAWWDAEVKPSIARDGRALLDEDLSACSAAGLAAHIRRAADFARRTVYFHHRLNCCAILPLADFLVHATGWTGLTPEEVLGALRGRSPLSAGAAAELDALRSAILADGDALSALNSGRAPADILATLQARTPAVGAALTTYLDVVGLRVVGGYDVADRHGREHPELLVNIIRSAVKAASDPGAMAAAGEAIRRVRARVPEVHHAEFDRLLEEAQLTYRVRDERNFCSDAIGVGVARRAILAAGERLRTEGRVNEAVHLVDATEDEIVSLLEGHGGPSAAELAGRYTGRLAMSMDAAPERLGVPPSAPPPAEWLPPAAARMQRAIDLALRLMFEVPTKQEKAGAQLKGFGVSPGVFEGPARVILDVADLPTVQAGEVLVTPSTGPTFNVVLPLLRAIVTERGGALSHAAIVAREYGIPAIVGCPGATAAVKTGSRVRVDGTTGEMWILG